MIRARCEAVNQSLGPNINLQSRIILFRRSSTYKKHQQKHKNQHHALNQQAENQSGYLTL